MLQFLSYSGLFISVCAVCYSIFYSILLSTPILPFRLLLIFFATLISYISVQLIPIYKTNVFHSRQLWFQKNKNILWAIIFVSAIVIAVLSINLLKTEFYLYAHLFLIVIFYEKVLTKKNELRKIPFLKPFLISYVWACMATYYSSYHSENFYLIMAESFIFILSLCIPFDIRDTEQDKKQGLITLVHILGQKKLKAICILLFILSLGILQHFIELKVSTVFSMIIMLAFYVFLIYKTKNDQHDYYFLYGIDSLIIFKLLLLL